MIPKLHTTILVLMMLSVVSVGVAVLGNYGIEWYTIDGGGPGAPGFSTGGDFELSGTMGQPDARNHPQPMTGGRYRLTGGFWVIPECAAFAPADYDRDCDVDQADYQLFEACASGPGIPHDLDCDDRDFDTDGDVDQSDFAVFQRCLSGEDNPADPNCAN